jgi:tRNA threonylcarbamoyladenosine biosynthesis protein TsaE
MAIHISHSPAETEELGASWGRGAERGSIIALSGELGAGKTRLVKGIARGLGINEGVHSPTFALINIYAGGRLPLFHLDLYRLETRDQIIGAGLEEYFQPAGVAVIEWAERWFGPAGSADQPADGVKLRRVEILVQGDNERKIVYVDTGT